MNFKVYEGLCRLDIVVCGVAACPLQIHPITAYTGYLQMSD